MPERILVHYPRGSATGGPEAMHQLVASLRSLGHNAFLYPLPWTAGNARSDRYDMYDAPEARLPATSRDWEVFPEIAFGACARSVAQRKFFWWLSIDNSPLFAFERTRLLKRLDLKQPTVRELAVLRARAFQVRQFYYAPVLRNDTVQHVTQSHYASEFLAINEGLSSLTLSDYTSLARPGSLSRNIEPNSNRPSIAYNAKKGGHLVQKVRDAGLVDANWVPLVDMTPLEVWQALEASTIYLDLGHQPGRDRMPREAAAAGCIVIGMHLGAGASSVDFDVPGRFKVDPTRVEASVLSTLRATLSDPTEALALQERYRASVRAEKSRFNSEVHMVFGSGGTGTAEPVA